MSLLDLGGLREEVAPESQFPLASLRSPSHAGSRKLGLEFTVHEEFAIDLVKQVPTGVG